jgi:hypothetical protein
VRTPGGHFSPCIHLTVPLEWDGPMTEPDDQSSTPPVPRRYAHPTSSRGTWTIVAIFLLGAAVLVGLFLAPRAKPPPAPPGQADGFPVRPLKVLVVDGALAGGAPAALITAGRALEPEPDVLMLTNVDAAVVSPVAEGFRMQASFHPQLYQRVKPEPGGRESLGVCLLARFPLFATEPARAADRRIVGVRSVAHVDGRAFRIACLNVRGETPAAPQGIPSAGMVITHHSRGDVSAALTAAAPAAGSNPAGSGSATRNTVLWVIEERPPRSEPPLDPGQPRPARLFVLKMVQLRPSAR